MTVIERKTWEEMAGEPASCDLGGGSFYQRSYNRSGAWVGITEWHKDPQGQLCGGWVPFDVPDLDDFYRQRAWRVVSLEPLHIEPSLLCNCGHHGFIRNGRWESC